MNLKSLPFLDIFHMKEPKGPENKKNCVAEKHLSHRESSQLSQSFQPYALVN